MRNLGIFKTLNKKMLKEAVIKDAAESFAAPVSWNLMENTFKLIMNILLFFSLYGAVTFIVLVVTKLTESLPEDRPFVKDTMLDVLLSDDPSFTPAGKKKISSAVLKQKPSGDSVLDLTAILPPVPLDQASAFKLVGWSLPLKLSNFLNFVVASHIGYFFSLFYIDWFLDVTCDSWILHLSAFALAVIYDILIVSTNYYCLSLGLTEAASFPMLLWLTVGSYLAVVLYQLFPFSISLKHIQKLTNLPNFIVETLFFGLPFVPFLCCVPQSHLKSFLEHVFSVVSNLGLYKFLNLGSSFAITRIEAPFSDLHFPIFSTMLDDLGSYIIPSINWFSSIGNYFTKDYHTTIRKAKQRPIRKTVKFESTFKYFLSIFLLGSVSFYYFIRHAL